ncbi:putative N amino acid transport system protein [Naematelia encephala]|uniref:Putative N amino acid transport system protein n=1 Tax=Naematelia encephala TaxID=71784 RepID=A0A1Y2B9B6_9TREE|nr:putative N amino acid transport system protein [Naematelia encephala]
MSDYEDKKEDTQTYVQSGDHHPHAGDDEFEVFKHVEGGVNYRTVGWFRASVIFLKVIFATGVLSIPSAMVALGSVGGALNVLGWSLINTYTALVLGRFRNRHAGCHTVADMAYHVGGPIFREAVGIIYLIAYVLCAGSGILGVSIGINALSDHAACTVVWTLIATIVVAAGASFPKFHQIGWLTWAGFLSIFTAVLIVVIGVTTRDRPYAAPATGDYELGYYAVPPIPATFIQGVTASVTIFVSSAGTSAFIPVISEMKRPQDYRKSLLTCMIFVTAAYLAFSLVVYRWCGQYVASPSLGSAGKTVEKVSYGIGLIGLAVSGVIYAHVGAKYLFVRILRNSRHLQQKTPTHWMVWLGCTFGLCAISFILAEAVPIFNYLVALTGSICFAPLALMLPAVYYFYDDYDKIRTGTMVEKFEWVCNVAIFCLGLFFLGSGTYAVAESIKAAYADGQIGSAFTCANNA